MKLLIHTYGYPSVNFPVRHTFVEEEARLLHNSNKASVSVLVTNPLRSLWNKKDGYNDEFFPVYEENYVSIPRRKFTAFTARQLQKTVEPYLDKVKPDLVHSHFIYPAGLIAPLLEKRGIPLVLTSHGNDFYALGSGKAERKRFSQVLEIAQKVICVGPRLKGDIEKAFPFANAKTELVMHSIDFNYFKPARDDEAVDSLEVQKTPGKIEVLCVSRISEVKGLHLLAEAIKKSDTLREKCRFHIVGPVSEPSYFEKFKKQLAYDDITNVLFHGPQNREELKKWYHWCDFYTQPSLSETFGLTVLEAVACGKPAVVTKSGGPDSIISDETGLISEINAADLADKLSVMAGHFSSYKADTLHRDVKAKFSPEVKSQKLINIYESVLNQ